MRRFRTIWRWLVPGFLQRGQGELVQWVQGLLFDAYAERMRQTAQLMYPSLCPDDALPLLGHDRAIPRGPLEPGESYRTRLIGWRYPRGHRTRGSAFGLLEQVAAAIGGTEYTSIDQHGTEYVRGNDSATKSVAWNWDGAADLPNWGRHWLVVKSTGTLWPSFDDGAWGPFVDGGADQCLAGEGIHPGEIAAVRQLAQATRLGWTPLGRQPVYLVIYFDGEAYPVPDGTWDEWGNRPAQDYAFEPLNDSVT